MAPARKFVSFDWYQETTGDYIEPVEVEEKAAEKAEKKVTIYITRQTINNRHGHFWAVTLYNEFFDEFRSHGVRKSFRHSPCTLMSSKRDPGVAGVDYILMGSVSCARGQELLDLCQTIPVIQSKSATYANREYINHVARFLVAGDFITKGQKKRAMDRFSNLINAERQQVEDERQKAEAEREKAKAQWQKSKNEPQSQNKANKNRSQGNVAFPPWFGDSGNN